MGGTGLDGGGNYHLMGGGGSPTIPPYWTALHTQTF